MLWRSLFFLIVLQSPAFGAPAISSFRFQSGFLLVHGSTVTLYGVGFGTRAVTRTLIFDTFDIGNGVAAWTAINNLSTTSTGGSTYSAYHSSLSFTSSAYDGMLAGGSNSSRWFVSYRFQIGDDWDWGTTAFGGVNQFLANIKFLRFWDTGSDTGNYYAQIGYPGLNSASYVSDEDFSDSNYYFNWTMNMIGKGIWHRVSAEWLDSSGLSSADGVFRIWVDGELKFSSSTLITRDATNVNNKRPQVVGFDNAWGPGGGESDDAPNTFYLDDVYADNQWTRVELSTSSTYAGSMREPQLITGWSNNAVTFTVNWGVMPTGVPIYAYVTDNSGVQSNGYRIDRIEVCPCK